MHTSDATGTERDQGADEAEAMVRGNDRPEWLALIAILRAVLGGFVAMTLTIPVMLVAWSSAEPLVKWGSVLAGCGLVTAVYWYGFAPAVRFALGRLRSGASHGRFRTAMSRVAATLALGYVTAVHVSFVRSGVEQAAWRPQDPARLDVVDHEHSAHGVRLTVVSTAGVDAVLRPQRSLLPWEPGHTPSAFRVRRVDARTEHVLVEMPLRPGAEWGLALRSRDGHWVALSPYFPVQPDLDAATWNELWSQAEPR